MIDYKDIFQKRGLLTPKTIYTPSTTEIENNFGEFLSNTKDIPYDELAHLSSFNLFMDPSRRILKVIDHNQFASFYNLDIDFSKLHPELFCSFDFYLTVDANNICFGMLLSGVLDISDENKLNKYLTHFCPEYPLQKVFSEDAEIKTTKALASYMRTTLDNTFKQAYAFEFIAELYEYIQQEQNKQQGVT